MSAVPGGNLRSGLLIYPVNGEEGKRRDIREVRAESREYTYGYTLSRLCLSARRQPKWQPADLSSERGGGKGKMTSIREGDIDGEGKISY